MLREREKERERENFMKHILSIYDPRDMTMCGYAHIIVLSGFLSSNGVTAPILLKFELFIQSSAITNTLVTLRPAVGRLDFFMLIGRKMRF